MNKIIISGNICKDNEIKTTNSGLVFLKNTLAVKHTFKTNEGYDVDFINFTAWRGNAEFLNKYTNKGDKILIEGALRTGNYENDKGEKVYTTEVVVERVEFISTKKKDNEQNKDPFANFGEAVELDDNFLD